MTRQYLAFASAVTVLAMACSEAAGPPSARVAATDPPHTIGTPSPITDLQIEMGGRHSCLVRTTGQLSCWGDNSVGQNSIPPTLGLVLQVSSLYDHTCAVTAKRNVVCWGGDNAAGQLNVPPTLGPVRSVTAGQAHSCAVRLDRTVVCWGDSTNPIFYPITVPTGLHDVVSLSSGPNYICAVLKTGGLTCWGDRDDGEADVPSGATSVIGAFGGYEQPCITMRDGRAYCWGQGWNPQPITYPIANVDSPYLNQIPAGLTNVRKLGGGNGRACAVTFAGKLYCWTTDTDHHALASLEVPTDAPVVAFDFHTNIGRYCVITSSGTVTCSAGANAGVAPPVL